MMKTEDCEQDSKIPHKIQDSKQDFRVGVQDFCSCQTPRFACALNKILNLLTYDIQYLNVNDLVLYR